MAAPKTQIRLDLRLPLLRLTLGGFTIDPVEKALGRSPEEVLRPRMVSPKREEQVGKKWVAVYPLGFRDGDGATLPLGPLGEVAFLAEGELLRVTVPAQFGAQVAERLQTDLVRGPDEAWNSTRQARVKHLWVRPRMGLRVQQAIGALGDISIEVV